jgi:hypothetical protein
MKNLLLAAVLSFSLIFVSGCKTTHGSVDLVKLQQVKDAVTPIAASGVRRVILNSPEHSEELASYFRAIGGIFCAMSDTGEFSPVTLITAVDNATMAYQLQLQGDEQIAIDVKNAVIAIYKIYYGDRFKAELPPESWVKNLSDVLCESINQGLKDAGKTGCK